MYKVLLQQLQGITSHQTLAINILHVSMNHQDSYEPKFLSYSTCKGIAYKVYCSLKNVKMVMNAPQFLHLFVTLFSTWQYDTFTRSQCRCFLSYNKTMYNVVLKHLVYQLITKNTWLYAYNSCTNWCRNICSSNLSSNTCLWLFACVYEPLLWAKVSKLEYM